MLQRRPRINNREALANTRGAGCGERVPVSYKPGARSGVMPVRLGHAGQLAELGGNESQA
jgi:hypothetical protein